MTAAEALGRFGAESDRKAAIALLPETADLRKHGVYVSMYALNALGRLGPLPPDARRAIEALPTSDPSIDARIKSGVPRLVADLLTPTK